MFNLKFSKAMKDFQWSFISLITASFAHLLLRIVLSKELGPSGLGLYTLVFTIYMFGTQFAAFGIGSALTKYIAEYHDCLPKIKGFVSSGIIGSMVSGSLLSILLYLLSGFISIQLFHSPEMTNLLRITAFCFPFIAVQKAVIGTLNGMRRMKLFAILNIGQNVSILFVTVGLVVWLNMGVRGGVLGFVVPTILVGLFSLTFTRSLFMKSFVKSPKILHSVLKEISWFGFYVVLSNSIGMINTQIDSLLIGHFMDETDVGYYAVAIIFMQGIILVPQAIQRVTTPLIAKFYGKGDFLNIQQLIKKTMLKTSGFIICISVFLVIFGKFLISMIFTEEFLPAYTPMLILLIGYSICAPIQSVGSTLSSTGSVNVVFKMAAICAFMNTLLNLLLIPKYGIIGAACATSVSQIVTLLIHLSFIKKYVFDQI